MSNDAYENGQLVPVTNIDESIYSEQPDVYREEETEQHKASEAIVRLLILIAETDKPRLATYQLIDSFGGLALIDSKLTGSKIAAMFGESKQDYEQGRERLISRIGQNCQTRRMKKEDASESYRLSNYRNNKSK